jgi:hypothetical protein
MKCRWCPNEAKKKWAASRFGDPQYCENCREKDVLYRQYQKGASVRGFSFEITPEDFQRFWAKECYYCGVGIPTVGIDRRDPSLGYDLVNCVSCCTRCNRMKTDIHHNEFLEHCARIARKPRE